MLRPRRAYLPPKNNPPLLEGCLGKNSDLHLLPPKHIKHTKIFSFFSSKYNNYPAKANMI